MDLNLIAGLTGADVVTRWFGGWPSFHDAEVISIFLARSKESVLRIYPYYPEKPATVDFIFNDVTDVDLKDFNGQNVIFDLTVETEIDQNGDRIYRVFLYPCYGMAGRIDARSVRIEMVPGKCPDGVSQW